LGLLLVLLLLSTVVANPAAQELSDEELAGQLEAVILEETVLPGAVNTLIEIPVRQDTYIASNKPSQNYGGSSELRLGYSLDGSDDGAVRTFVQFDVNSYVPSQATVNSAYLRMYVFSYTPFGDSSMTALARNLLTSWSEYQVTWNSHQPHWGSVLGYGDVAAQLDWQQWDVTELVREWHNGTVDNNGIILIGDENVQERQRFFHSLNANNGLYPRLEVDYTESTDNTPPEASVDPLPAWSQRNFTVAWSGTDFGGSGIAYYDVEYNANGGPWSDFVKHTTSNSAEFEGGQNGVTYQFRCRAVDYAGNVQDWGPAQTQTKVDSIAPTASVEELPEYTYTQAFDVSWSGSDNLGGSGIAGYDVQFQQNGGPWQDWLDGTTQTRAQFTGAQDDGVYGFRASGIDVAGNVQSFSLGAQAQTIVETSSPRSIINPFKPTVTQEDSFPVSWTGWTAPGLTIVSYDVWYQFNNSPWINWLPQTALTSAEFTDLNPEDGVYGFEVQAKDSGGRVEKFHGVAEARIAVDRHPPFIEPRIYLPLVSNDSE
jgi:hypothetical protein